ncbi:MAG: T9SS type A sorting domain-containing protein [Saprospiraceae bacterium]
MTTPLVASSSSLQPFTLSEIIISDHSGLLASIISKNSHVNVEENSQKSENYYAYPNPAGNILSIYSKTSINDINIELLNNSGSIIKALIKNKEIDISNLAPGIYYIRFNSKESIKFSKL